MSLGADWSTSHAHSFAVQLAYLQAEVNYQDEPFGTDFSQVCVHSFSGHLSPLPWGESQGLTHSTSNCVLFMFLSSFFIYSFAERACLVRSWKLGHSRGEDVELLTFDSAISQGVACRVSSQYSLAPCSPARLPNINSLAKSTCSAPRPLCSRQEDWRQ